MPSRSLVAQLREGDPWGWPWWRPEELDPDQVIARWKGALGARGTAGVPEPVQVYVHFPFCEASCNFCMYWHQVPKREGAQDQHAEHLVALVERYATALGRPAVTSAYFGGGTPSAVPTPALGRFLDAFSAAFDVRGQFTFEGHPASIDREKVSLLARHRVDRLSIGLQSFDPQVLRKITRRNRPFEELLAVVRHARGLGMTVNVDLVYGLPEQSVESIRADLLRVVELEADTVTFYRYRPTDRLPVGPPVELTASTILGSASFLRELGPRLRRHPRPLGLLKHFTVGNLPLGRLAWNTLGDLGLLRDDPRMIPFHTACHVLGLGPGAYSHLFGWAWYRDVSRMETLDGRPSYMGTRIDHEDELRQLLLVAIGEQRWISPAQLRHWTTLDVERTFASVFSAAEAAGQLERRGERLRLRRGASPELVDTLRRLLLPDPPPTSGGHYSLPVAPDAARVERELIQLQGHDAQDPALVRRFCEALGVPKAGLRLEGALVLRSDDRSIYFAVEGKHEPPLRVLVYPPEEPRAFARGGSFSFQYGSRPERALTASEAAFLEKLRARMAAADPAAAVG